MRHSVLKNYTTHEAIERNIGKWLEIFMFFLYGSYFQNLVIGLTKANSLFININIKPGVFDYTMKAIWLFQNSLRLINFGKIHIDHSEFERL